MDKQIQKLFGIGAILIMLISSCNNTKVMYTSKDSKRPTSINYLHTEKPSFKAKFIKFALNLTVSKTAIQQRFEKNDFASTSSPISKKVAQDLNIVVKQMNGRDVTYLSPLTNPSENIIIFLHGGGYINNIRKQHWNFIHDLIEKSGSTVIVPDYYLAPNFTYEPSFELVEKLYDSILNQNPNKKIILMGDSAGGGFALSLAEKIQVEKKVQPHQIILISPWLDVTNSNPEIDSIQPLDPFLKDTKGFRMAGKAYAGNTDPSNYLLSPINGNLKNLAPISIFTGTHETLYADAKKFKKMCDEQEISIGYFVYPKMFHDFMMVVALPEAQNAMGQVVQLLSY